MGTEELIERISEREPLLAKAVSHMVAYVQDRYPSTFSEQGADYGGKRIPAQHPC